MQQLVSDEQLTEWFPGEPLSELKIRRDAAEAHIQRHCTIPADPEDRGDLVMAVQLLVARFLARRNSPDGTLGMSEFGVGRIATVDRDIEALLAPHKRVVFG